MYHILLGSSVGRSINWKPWSHLNQSNSGLLTTVGILWNILPNIAFTGPLLFHDKFEDKWNQTPTFPVSSQGSLASHLPLFFLQLLLYGSFLEVNYIFIEDKCLRNLFQTFGGEECDFLTSFKTYKGDWSSVFILEVLFSVAVGGFSNVTMRLMVMAFSVLPFYRYWTHLQILS